MHGDRQIPPVIVRLEGKEMKNIKLSEETGVTLRDGWVEITSTKVDYVYWGYIWRDVDE